MGTLYDSDAEDEQIRWCGCMLEGCGSWGCDNKPRDGENGLCCQCQAGDHI